MSFLCRLLGHSPTIRPGVQVERVLPDGRRIALSPFRKEASLAEQAALICRRCEVCL